jgi:hypothetical protein
VPFSAGIKAHKDSVRQFVAELFEAEPPGETFSVSGPFVNKVLARCEFHQSSFVNLRNHIRKLDIVPSAPPRKPRAAPVPMPSPDAAKATRGAKPKDLVVPPPAPALADMPGFKRKVEKQRETMPRKCNGCDKNLPRGNFTDEQWGKNIGQFGSDQKRLCKDCEAKGVVPEAKEVVELFNVPIIEDASVTEDLSPLALPENRAGTCEVLVKIRVAAEPEESRRSRALAVFESRRLQKTLHAVVVASEDSEVGEYSMPVRVFYDAEGQPFTTRDRVTRALVESAYGTMSQLDVIATREERWLPDLVGVDKHYRLVLAIAEDVDDYVNKSKAATLGAAWIRNPRRHRSGAPSRRRRTTPYRSISTQEALGHEPGRGGWRREILHFRVGIATCERIP